MNCNRLKSLKSRDTVQKLPPRIKTPVSLPDSRSEWHLAEPLSNSGVSFPLAPALSLGERVPFPPSLEMPARFDLSQRCRCFSLSLGERAGVRGNKAHAASRTSRGLWVTALSLLPAALLALASCSSPPPPDRKSTRLNS